MEQIVVIEAEEIKPTSFLRFYDRRNPEVTLVWIKPSNRLRETFVISRELVDLNGVVYESRVRECRDQVECIQLVRRNLDNNPIGLDIEMQII